MSISNKFLMGVDISSSSCKISLIDCSGNLVAFSQSSYTALNPQPGWAEQNPEIWYQALCKSVKSCLEQSDISGEQIQALSVCGPAHNAVLLDRDEKVLRPVILWFDRRSDEQAEWLDEQFGSLIFETTYQPVNPSWTLAQLLWINQNESKIWDNIDRIIIGKDYINYRLTGAWVTDKYDAIGTQLFDIKTNSWSQELCEAIELPLSSLPIVHNVADITGFVTQLAAEETGLSPGTPVAVGSGDSVVEALGIGVINPNQGIIKLATSGAVNVVTAKARPDPKVMTYCHLIRDKWMTICATNSGASAAEWFYHSFGIQNLSDQGIEALEYLASNVKPGSEGLIFHPYLKGERAPHWDPLMRGDFVGITSRHHINHFARAVLEGVAYSIRECLGLVASIGIPLTEIRLIGGGASSSLWCQIMADILGRELPRIMGDATSHGAALLAGVAVGVFDSFDQATAFSLYPQDVFYPQSSSTIYYDRYFDIYQEITKRLIPLQHALSEIDDQMLDT